MIWSGADSGTGRSNCLRTPRDGVYSSSWFENSHAIQYEPFPWGVIAIGPHPMPSGPGGIVISLMVPFAGKRTPRPFEESSSNQTSPLESTAIPSGRAPGVGMSNSEKALVCGLKCPIWSLPCSTNQMPPLASDVIWLGPVEPFGSAYCVME